MTLYLLIISEVVLAYLIGSIPTSVWVGKLFYKIDIREHGSGNAGATNTIRVLGYRAGLPVMAFDIFKGWFAVQLATLFPDAGLAPDAIIYLEMALAVSAVLGHIFPVYVGFRGGKGVGTMAGVAVALYPLGLLIAAVVFAGTLAISRYVSLSSVMAAITFPFIVLFVTGQHNPGLIALAFFVAVFVPATHRKNIRRLLKGEENRFDFRRKKKNTA
jgi:glycerol-3-phosphate acyltransferase PlsY